MVWWLQLHSLQIDSMVWQFSISPMHLCSLSRMNFEGDFRLLGPAQAPWLPLTYTLPSYFGSRNNTEWLHLMSKMFHQDAWRGYAQNAWLFFCNFDTHTGPILKALGILKFHDIRLLQFWISMYSYHNSVFPAKFDNTFPLNMQFHSYNTRNQSVFHVPLCKTSTK